MGQTPSRAKQLTKNVILFTIGSIGTKLIAFFMVPLYTNKMSTSEYGTLDLITTVISIAYPVLSFSVDATVFRFCLDKNYKKETVITNSSIMWGRALLLNFLLVLPLYLFAYLFKIENKHLFVIGYLLIFFCVGSNEYINSMCRGLDRVALTTIGSIVYSLLFVSSNIVLLSVYDLGIIGYITSQVVSTVFFLALMTILVKYPGFLKRSESSKSVRAEMRNL